eukprot:CAMPEP_0198142806 /NCGR_PEP_ID=MMETSP1443-20131203/5494_1 /TAXON_ID=186043 /ORGANISM="Entomoneis sp., Strain CCMP2396" /LENGTH=361 /DNA_ID=CAMNT_0043805901 /DNA_START=16 /DNA_END=1101 /DNA_ORIENTATION=-
MANCTVLLRQSVWKAYLQPLLLKHESKKQITHEDLLASKAAADITVLDFEKEGNSSNSGTAVSVKAELETLHQSQLNAYQEFARSEIAAWLSHCMFRLADPSKETTPTPEQYQHQCVKEAKEQLASRRRCAQGLPFPKYRVSDSVVEGLLAETIEGRAAKKFMALQILSKNRSKLLQSVTKKRKERSSDGKDIDGDDDNNNSNASNNETTTAKNDGEIDEGDEQNDDEEDEDGEIGEVEEDGELMEEDSNDNDKDSKEDTNDVDRDNNNEDEDDDDEEGELEETPKEESSNTSNSNNKNRNNMQARKGKSTTSKTTNNNNQKKTIHKIPTLRKIGARKPLPAMALGSGAGAGNHSRAGGNK